MKRYKHKVEDYWKLSKIYHEFVDSMECRVTSELGDMYDVDMLSRYLYELEIDHDVAYCCCLMWLGEKAFEKFQYPPRRIK